jgi:hypothetical protein
VNDSHDGEKVAQITPATINNLTTGEKLTFQKPEHDVLLVGRIPANTDARVWMEGMLNLANNLRTKSERIILVDVNNFSDGAEKDDDQPGPSKKPKHI